MREEKEANTSDSDADMIAQLPDHILDNLLFFLPTADAAVMATVSKYWLNLWNSFITVHFSFNETTQGLQSLLPTFLPCVKDSLNFLGSPEENPVIHSFVLNMHFSKQRRQFHHTHNMLYISKISTCLDDWISLLLQNDVKHVKIRFSNMIYYVPPDIFWGTLFLTVHVEGCHIIGDPIFCTGNSSFNCLTELVLVSVQTCTYTVHKILSYSPLLEKVVLRNLSKMDYLVICNLPRLSHVEVEQALEHKIEIRAPNLSTLILKLYGSIEGFFSESFTGGVNFGSKKIAFEHAMLKTLKLCFTSCARVKVACSNLRTMSLSNEGSEIPLDVEVDAPKLEQLDYDGYVIPSFHGVTSLLKPIVTLKLILGGCPGLDVAARSCIEMFNQPTLHLIYIYRGFFKAQEILWPGQV
ncbi:putative F-box/LRR-repeat protein At5g41630 [Vigna unguiculata]|uniref:putative F-box/LRR-repeat protein At5g41630 n=1 Tax=Vigna unguiculata TaxID=3917 RepID=UPI0010162FDA|nr:putative F-box/LRR-repeat protein At5g41630 [Vigna unguiculata]